MKNKKNRDGGFIYSTNPDAYKAFEEEPLESLKPEQQDLRVWLEKGGRGGKIASVIKGYVGNEIELKMLAASLKSKIGTGGNAKDGEIIIQGDHRDKIVELLLKDGYKAKKAGG